MQGYKERLEIREVLVTGSRARLSSSPRSCDALMLTSFLIVSPGKLRQHAGAVLSHGTALC